MLLESVIDHEYPLVMKMEVEAPMVGEASRPSWVVLHRQAV